MRSIPIITKNLLIINILVFLATYVIGGASNGIDTQYSLNETLGLHFILAPDFHIYQLFTYMFAHASFTHLFFNMFALWMFGGLVESVFGKNRFLFYYIVCGIGAGLIQEMAQFVQFYLELKSQVPGFTMSQLGVAVSSLGAALNTWTTVGASGAVYGILLAFGMLFPDQRIFIFPIPVPIKAKWFVVIYAAIEVFSAMSNTNSNVAHLAHLGGMIFGLLLIKYWQRHPMASAKIDDVMSLFGNIGKQQFKKNTTNNSSSSTGNADWDYNKQKRDKEREIDEILDKIRRNGYDSLSNEEKKKLLDNK